MNLYLRKENARTLKNAEKKPYYKVQSEGSKPRTAVINALYFQTNSIDKILDDENLKFLIIRSSVFQMLPSCLKFKIIGYLTFS